MPTERPDPNNRDNREEPNGDSEALPELRWLDTRLSQDGAYWRAALPAPDRLARRLNAALKAESNSVNSSAPESDFSVPRVTRLSGRPHAPPTSSGDMYMRQQRSFGRIFAGGAILALVALFAVLLAVFHGFPGAGSPGNHPTAAPTTHATSVATQAPTAQATVAPTQSVGNTGPFTVTSVGLTVSPTSIAGKSCGTSITFTYTVTFHLPQGNKGGTIQFMYTLDNGRSSTPAHVSVTPGQTTQQYTITSSGTLTIDHTYPGVAEVIVNSPNAVNSPQVKPAGACQ